MNREEYFCRLLATYIVQKLSEFDVNSKEVSLLKSILNNLKENGFAEIKDMDVNTVERILMNGMGVNNDTYWIEDEWGYLHCSACGYELADKVTLNRCPKCSKVMSNYSDGA